MADKELLEAAARAAGYLVRIEGADLFLLSEDAEGDWTKTLWNPLADDGEALRLAVKLEFGIAVFSAFVEVTDGLRIDASERTEADPVAATRRAIVRAAAEIGSLHNAMYVAKPAT